MRDLFTELKRRSVFRVGGAYAVVAWILIEVSDTIFPRLGLPDWTVTLVIVLLLLGFPLALFLSWAYELTPRGQLQAMGFGARTMSLFNPASHIVIMQNLPALRARLRGESRGTR